MQISYSNYPILEKLNKGSLGKIPIIPEDLTFFNLQSDSFITSWKRNISYFSSSINFVSQSFAEASVKAEVKLMELFTDIVKNDLSDMSVNGTFLIGDVVMMLHYDVKKGTEDCEIAFYMFYKTGIPILYFVESCIHKVYTNGWVSNHCKLMNNHDNIKSYIFSYIEKALLFSLFKSYAQVEIKELLPHKKTNKDGIKYVNNTHLKIIHLDSLWFTTLVKSGAFNVSGHFRLQPYKDRKELIWIADFEKHGYTRKAKKLSFYPEEP